MRSSSKAKDEGESVLTWDRLRGPVLKGAVAAVLLAGMHLVSPAMAADGEAARLVILANASDPESVQLANAYAALRAIPVANIIALPLSAAETITWPEFVATLHRPLQTELLRRGWIEGIAMDLVDEAGRRKVAVSSHRISYLVVCRGVPLAIDHDPALAMGPARSREKPEFRTNAASVDAELSLLAWPRPPLSGWIANPLFGAGADLRWTNPVIKVGRLDAPTLAQAIALVEGALAAERTGLTGPAVFDLGGPEPAGDRWLEDALALAVDFGLETRVERTGATLAPDADVAGAALYFGWYAPDVNGPFLAPGFRFAPGAITMHIHSMSARTLRSEREGWTGPLVALGAAASVGNVAEPYLQLTHRPDLLLRGLLAGETLGDAAYGALPALGWMPVVVGDPLYRPFPRRSL